ncbi:nose resistant to fluoxetine protein 6-like [Sitophilus oryzae]|uniref:Nose resistant to fluoxetine protein 6-like n=1 Tax=Sitophilus oryzae TaxID=7048 RepID=A0A6J2Y5L1_SITOR|nr:nose resistant to fluoxetine protein 6-like [Sitophilus oryzae]
MYISLNNALFYGLVMCVLCNSLVFCNIFSDKVSVSNKTKFLTAGNPVESILKSLSTECAEDFSFLVKEFENKELWALKALGSFLNSPTKDTYNLGNFDECVDILRRDQQKTIQGQYCLSEVSFNENDGRRMILKDNYTPAERNEFKNNHIYLGICLPLTCRRQDVEVIVKEMFNTFIDDDIKDISVKLDDESCYFKQKQVTSTEEIIYGSIISLFLLFILFSTILHVLHIRKRMKSVVYSVEKIRDENNTVKNEVIFSFSLIQTVGKLLQTKPNELNLECICGIKFWSMTLIIIGHSLIFVFGGPVVNTDFFQETSTEVQNGIFLNNPLLVDSFLLISGFLMCHLLLIELEKRNGKINVFILYIARYIRLTPAYLVVIGFYMTWLPSIGSGPFWDKFVVKEKERCLKSWWTNLLYINNYVQTDSLCMFQAWYLATDYHLFIIAPFIIFALWKWKNVGLSSLVSLIFCAALLSFYITLKDNLDPTLMAFPPEIQDLSTNFYFVTSYIKTHMRASSYFIGMLFGYIVHRIQIRAIKISKPVQWIGWITTTLFGITSIFSIVVFYSPNYQYDNIEASIYASLHRIMWSLFVGWVITMCVTENANSVNKFLSYKAFIPLSRLTYCAYLINGLIEIYHKGILRQPLLLTKFDLACRLLGHVVITFFFAFLLCICFESPIHGLEKILLRKKDTRPEKPAVQSTIIRVIEENE